MKEMAKLLCVVFVLLFASNADGSDLPPLAVINDDSVTVTIGNGTLQIQYPFSTFWMAGRTQMLILKGEILAGGGSAGTISSLGFDVSSYDTIMLHGFNIRLRNTEKDGLTEWITDSMSNGYSGQYRITGNGWQMIALQNAFFYKGGNLLIEICYTNGTSSNFSKVYGTQELNTPWRIFTYNADNSEGCLFAVHATSNTRPNTRLIIHPGVAATGTVKTVPLKIYPNPASGDVFLESANGIDRIRIIDFNGKEIATLEGINSVRYRLELTDFTSGIYFVEVTGSYGDRDSKVLVVR